MSGSPDQLAARRLFGTDPLGDAWAASGLFLVDVDGASPQVSVAVGNRSWYAQLWLDPEEAGKVADLLDLLTYATSAQMQRLVRGIRDAIEIRASAQGTPGTRQAPAASVQGTPDISADDSGN